MHTDTRHQKTKIIHPTEHKIAITRKLLEHEQVSPAGLGKVAYVEETISGNSLNFFLKSVYPVLYDYGCTQLFVIAAIDNTSKAKQTEIADPPNASVKISRISLPLIFTDRSIFLNTLAIATGQEQIMPQTVHNVETRKIVEIITLAHLHPARLKSVLDNTAASEKGGNQLQELVKEVTKDMPKPEVFIDWLKRYYGEIN